MWAPLFVLGAAGLGALADALWTQEGSASYGSAQKHVLTPITTSKEQKALAGQLRHLLRPVLEAGEGGGATIHHHGVQIATSVPFMPCGRPDLPCPVPKEANVWSNGVWAKSLNNANYDFAAGVARALGAPARLAPIDASDLGMEGGVIWFWPVPEPLGDDDDDLIGGLFD